MHNNAKHYYEIECKQRAHNQSTIFDWIHSYIELRSGRLIGDGLRDAWAVGRRPRARPSLNYDDDVSEEYEFHWESNSRM